MDTCRCSSLPFSLRNGTATYQRNEDIILSGARCQMRLVYLNEIIVFSPDPESHVDHVDHILTFLGETDVKLKLKNGFCLRPRASWVYSTSHPPRGSSSYHNR